MKTALMNTDRFWKEDRVFELLPDARYFYLCLLTNPERNTTPAFKCSDRLMVAYTGYNLDTIKLCQEVLIERGFIVMVDGYYIINEQDYVKPSKGKLSQKMYEKYYNALPKSVQDLLMSRSCVPHEYKVKVKDKVKKEVVDKEINKVSQAYYQLITNLGLPVNNHAVLKTRIKSLEKDIGENKALAYIEFLSTIYDTLPDDGYKPRIVNGLDIYSKRLQIKAWIDKIKADNDQRQARIF